MGGGAFDLPVGVLGVPNDLRRGGRGALALVERLEHLRRRALQPVEAILFVLDDQGVLHLVPPLEDVVADALVLLPDVQELLDALRRRQAGG